MKASAYILSDPVAFVNLVVAAGTMEGDLKYWVDGRPITETSGTGFEYWTNGQPIDREDDN